jgi:hypothetical protein
MHRTGWALVLALAALLWGSGAASAGKLRYGGPDAIGATRSLRTAIRTAAAQGRSLHIVFVHGIRAERAGGSQAFTKRLAKALGAPPPLSAQRRMLTLQPWPETATTSGGQRIWLDEAEWTRSSPFVERSTITASIGTVVVDEVNYWPLLFPLKCRFLLAPEHDLAGNDIDHLKLCGEWIGEERRRGLLSTRPKSGGGAKLNASLKHQIMNWGLSDAVIALGPMRIYLNAAIDQAFAYALAGRLTGEDYVVVSESLGSFVVLDAYARGARNVAALLDRTADLYFLANQFALLDLARIEGLPPEVERAGIVDPTAASPVDAAQAASPMQALATWAGPRTRNAAADPGLPRQIVAFSDPSDLLTYPVRKLGEAKVVNVYVRNGRRFLGLVADPVKAHIGHVGNDAIWALLMR